MQRSRGHFNYFGVSGNVRSLLRLANMKLRSLSSGCEARPAKGEPARVGSELTRRLRGHFNYFGVSGNVRSSNAAKRAWYQWLCRRSQRARLTWERFADLLDPLPLPRPRITVRIWGP